MKAKRQKHLTVFLEIIPFYVEEKIEKMCKRSSKKREENNRAGRTEVEKKIPLGQLY